MRRSRKVEEVKPGCGQVTKPRAWVIRVPAKFIAIDYMNAGGYQTVVMAENSDTWEVLDFNVTTMAVFPKDPV